MKKEIIYACADNRKSGAYHSWYKANEDNYHCNFIYLHFGDLERANASDLCLTRDEWVDNLCAGVYPVLVNMWEFGIREATMFFWLRYGQPYGLIVDNYDDKAMKDARERYEKYLNR